VLQKTIKNSFSASGVGIHSGNPVTLLFHPAAEDEGIGFIRTDIDGNVRVPAHYTQVHNTELATTLTEGETSISTVEHVMAALSALNIDNATLMIDGPEVPIFDGSAAPLVTLIRSTGSREVDGKRRAALITKNVRVESGDSWAEFSPHEGGLLFDYTIVYDNPHIGTQNLAFELNPDYFEREIAPARTYGLMNDVDAMFAKGLAQGGSFENAVIIADDGVLNPNGLRFPDECVRHKCLDAIGDLALFGMPLIGKFTAYKSGHRLNHLLIRKIAENKAYKIIEQ
jgi:UDP-3-O-[3-hydroxymyristoyl] N-acetylglucosamine deacetylase